MELLRKNLIEAYTQIGKEQLELLEDWEVTSQEIENSPKC